MLAKRKVAPQRRIATSDWLLTSREAAGILAVPSDLVVRISAAGLLRSIPTTGGPMFRLADVVEFAARRAQRTLPELRG